MKQCHKLKVYSALVFNQFLRKSDPSRIRTGAIGAETRHTIQAML